MQSKLQRTNVHDVIVHNKTVVTNIILHRAISASSNILQGQARFKVEFRSLFRLKSEIPNSAKMKYIVGANGFSVRNHLL